RFVGTVNESVQIARNRLVPRPTGHTNINGKFRAGIRVERYFDLTIPGIARFLGDFDGASVVQFDLGLVCREEIHVKSIALLRIQIAGDRRHETSDIARTTGATKPRAARMLPVGLQGVWIA